MSCPPFEVSHIVFDIDGTLTDYRAAIVAGLEAAAAYVLEHAEEVGLSLGELGGAAQRGRHRSGVARPYARGYPPRVVPPGVGRVRRSPGRHHRRGRGGLLPRPRRDDGRLPGGRGRARVAAVPRLHAQHRLERHVPARARRPRPLLQRDAVLARHRCEEAGTRPSSGSPRSEAARTPRARSPSATVSTTTTNRPAPPACTRCSSTATIGPKAGTWCTSAGWTRFRRSSCFPASFVLPR